MLYKEIDQRKTDDNKAYEVVTRIEEENFLINQELKRLKENLYDNKKILIDHKNEEESINKGKSVFTTESQNVISNIEEKHISDENFFEHSKKKCIKERSSSFYKEIYTTSRNMYF